MTMQTPTAEQVREWMLERGWTPARGRGGWWYHEGRGSAVDGNSVSAIAHLHGLDPFVVRCQMLGFQPVTDKELTEWCEDPEFFGSPRDPDAEASFEERIAAHLRATGTVQP